MEHDLTLFEAGDATEVGERGLTLRYVASYRQYGTEKAQICIRILQWWSEGVYYYSYVLLAELTYELAGSNHPRACHLLSGENHPPG